MAGEAPLPTQIEPEPDSRLEQLCAEYDEAKAAYEAATERFTEIKDAIKGELQSAAPHAQRVQVASAHLARPLRMSQREQWRLNTAALKKEDPLTYVRFAQKSVSWYLEALRG